MRSGKSRLAAGSPERALRQRAQRHAVAQHVEAAAQGQQLGLLDAAQRQVVDDALDADARRRVVGLAARFGRDELAVGARREVRLPERFAARRPQLRQRAARVDADLARAGLGVELLPDAEAGFLLAHVRGEIEPLGDVLDLREIGRRARHDGRTPFARARRALPSRRSGGT